MSDWQQHRKWIVLLSVAFILAAIKAPLLDGAQREAARKLDAMHAQKEKTDAALAQFQSDLAEIDKMKDVIDDREIEKFMMPVDRLRAAQILEHRAHEARLSHFTYNMSPEEKTNIDTVSAGKQEMAISKITFAADAPTDNNIYAFFDAVRRTLPGRIALHDMIIARIDSADKPIKAANLRMTASADWLSNGSAKNLVEETP
jgi:hypothetical protein